MNFAENLANKYSGMLLPIQAVATELGVTESYVEDLIYSGALPALTVGEDVRVSAQALANILGFSSAFFGQHTSGYPAENTIYLNHHIESEDSGMAYTGSVSHLKDGRFMVQINLGKGVDGSRKRESKSFRDEDEANRYLDKRLAQLNGSDNQDNVPISASSIVTQPQNGKYTLKTVEEYALYILNRGIGKAGSRTIDGYRWSILPVLSYIGNEKIKDIKDEQIINIFRELSYKYADSSLKKTFTTTKIIFDEAYAKKDIPNNLFLRLKCPKSRKPATDERTPYTDEEIKILFLAAKEYQNKLVYPIFTVLECTGMRPSEMRALEWSDFNIKKKRIRIKQAIVTVYDKIENMRKSPKSHEIIGKTKSDWGIRTVPLSDFAVSALIEWRKELDKMKPAMKNSKFIFPSQEGNFKSRDSIKGIMQRFIKNVDLEDMGFMLYRFRHTMCTRLVLDRQPIKVIQRILGDITGDVIMKTYSHVEGDDAIASCSNYFDRRNQIYKTFTNDITK